MESLYRTYRPNTFQQVVGQQAVVSTLERAVTEDRVSHAYLFCGPRGTGKTTMARILAKALLCEQAPGHLPDGTCDHCQAVAAGNHPDVHELDAASRTGVEAVREEIINHVDFAPSQGAYKIYIVDEVHMLSTQAFNALLKTLEEPPQHVVFILCTTDPQKIPATILSRVQRLEFRSISAGDIAGHLGKVCEAEGFSAEPDALSLVARRARGGMRDALSTLEQLSVFCDGAITLEAARSLLGEGDADAVSGLIDGLARHDPATAFRTLALQVEEGHDVLLLTKALAVRLRDIYVATIAGVAPGLVEADGSEAARLAQEAQAFGSPTRVARVLALMEDCASALRFSSNQRLTLEVALAKAADPGVDGSLEALAERLDLLEARLAAAQAAGTLSAAPERQAAPSAEKGLPSESPAPGLAEKLALPSTPAEPAGAEKGAPSPAPTGASVPASVSADAPNPNAPAESIPTPATHAAEPAAAPQDLQAWARRWAQAQEHLAAERPLVASALAEVRVACDDGASLVLAVPDGARFARGLLGRADVMPLVTEAVTSAFGSREVRVQGGTDLEPLDEEGEPSPESRTSGNKVDVQPASAPSSAPAAAPASAPSPAAAPAARPAGKKMPWDDHLRNAPVATPAPEGSAAAPWSEAPVSGSAAENGAPVSPGTGAPSMPAASSMPSEPPAPAPDDEPPFEELYANEVPSDEAPQEAPADALAPVEPPAGLTPEQSATFSLVAEMFGDGVRVLPVEDGEAPTA